MSSFSVNFSKIVYSLCIQFEHSEPGVSHYMTQYAMTIPEAYERREM